MGDLHVVFNFYEKITPPPKFKTFVEGWKHLGQFVEKLDEYVGAQLHENLDPKGLFPYMNFATFRGSEESVIKQMTEPTPELIQALVEGHGLPGHQVNHPGGYNEIATDDQTPIAPDFPPRKDSLYLVSCFQVDPNSVGEAGVEANWRQISGLDAIKSFVESQGRQMGRAGFYRRFTPASPFATFSHVFRCEMVGYEGTEPELWEMTRSLVETTNGSGVGRVNSSLYKVSVLSNPRNNNK